MLLLLALLAALCVASLGRGAYTQDDYEALISLKAASLQQPYVDSDLQNRHWDFGGDTIIDTSRGVRLTQDKKSQRGWLWTRNPIRARDFQITFEFAIHGRSHHLFGDGMALWLTADRAKQGNAFGNQGTFQGLGIAFDTYANGRHPYAFPRVMALQGTKYTPYVQDQDGANLEVGGCSIPFRDTPVAARGRLTYVDGEYLELQLHTKEWEEWETCFEIEHFQLPQEPFLGFTAATGDVSDNHEIISVETHSIVHKPLSQGGTGRGRTVPGAFGNAGKAGDTGGAGGPGFIHRTFSAVFGVVWFLIKVALVLGVVGGGIFYFYKYKRVHNAKRF